MSKTSVYLNFPGTTEDAFNFYQTIFGGENMGFMRYGDMPNPEQPLPDELAQKIMHTALPVGDMILMGADAIEGFGPPIIYGNNFSISVSAESNAEADSLFGKLADGGIITMPMQNTFWGDYFGMCTDKFGINWMVSFALPKE
ncbi:MAG: glyoxalase [Ignavibacteria bacterium GWF2_33_9]|nr:MAG: glyoxalase [Ignavibacteria bacterium GWF2_33_9]